MRHALRLVVLNGENLFLLLDQEPSTLRGLSEKEWQRHSSSVYENKPLGKLQALARSFEIWQADIIALGEVGGEESLRNFNRLFLEHNYRPLLIEGNSDRAIDLGFLVKKDLPLNVEVRSNRERYLGFHYPHEKTPSDPQGHKFSRDVAELHLSTDGKLRAVVFLVHLKSKRDPDLIDAGGARRRRAEFDCLVDIVGERSREHPGVDFIVAGDFNGQVTGPGAEPEFQSLARTDWVDVFDLLGVPREKRSTYFPPDLARKSDGVQLDYAFVARDRAHRVRGAEVGGFHNPFGLVLRKPANALERELIPSDHLPIVVDWEVGE
jgi:endonuclease/exonuclease/phosphatase family metal-dependent hydrolase